jgi:hypothetical protein
MSVLGILLAVVGIALGRELVSTLSTVIGVGAHVGTSLVALIDAGDGEDRSPA